MKRKKAVQQELGLRFWGGRRAGAGRPNRSGLRAHVKRPELNGRTPLHVTVKVNDRIPNLKRKSFFAIFREAVVAAREHGVRVNHYSIQSNHIHLILEASTNKELEGGMKSLGLRISLAIKRRLGARTGSPSVSVFKDRYHLHVLKTPTEVKRAIRYVLLNEYKHTGSQSFENGDVFSSVSLFQRQYAEESWRQPATDELTHICSPPRTWLLRIGWIQARA